MLVKEYEMFLSLCYFTHRSKFMCVLLKRTWENEGHPEDNCGAWGEEVRIWSKQCGMESGKKKKKKACAFPELVGY